MLAATVVAASLFGAVVGSFLNVVIHRVPAGASLVRPPSACPACATPIRPRDNIPVVSYLLLRGRCRTCGRPISRRYPVVEAMNAALWVGAALRFENIERAAFAAFSISVLLALAAIDLEHRRLPNVIVLPSTAAAIAWTAGYALWDARLDVLATALVCGLLAFALFLLIALISAGMGLGDVKLAGFIGVVAGRFAWEIAVTAIFAAFFIGGAVAVSLLVFGRAGRKQAIPFGPAMAVGAVVAVFVGPGPARAWLGL